MGQSKQSESQVKEHEKNENTDGLENIENGYKDSFQDKKKKVCKNALSQWIYT